MICRSINKRIKNCLIHGPGYFYDKCKVLGDFGAKYDKGKTTKDHGNNSTPRKIKRQKEKNSIINNIVDEILLNRTQKLSAAREAPEFLGRDYDVNDLFKAEKMSLE